MQHTQDARRASTSTKTETRQRADDAMADELAFINQVARLVEPVHTG